jgi:hypothetical protein
MRGFVAVSLLFKNLVPTGVFFVYNQQYRNSPYSIGRKSWQINKQDGTRTQREMLQSFVTGMARTGPTTIPTLRQELHQPSPLSQ